VWRLGPAVAVRSISCVSTPIRHLLCLCVSKTVSLWSGISVWSSVCPDWETGLGVFFFLFFFSFVFCFFETGSCYAVQAGLKLTVFLPQPPGLGVFHGNL
jgi:hypothetical protein